MIKGRVLEKSDLITSKGPQLNVGNGVRRIKLATKATAKILKMKVPKTAIEKVDSLMQVSSMRRNLQRQHDSVAF